MLWDYVYKIYLDFISDVVYSVFKDIKEFLTLKAKWQVFKAYMMNVLLHLVTKHGIYNLISHKRRAVIIQACQKGTQNHVLLHAKFTTWFPTLFFFTQSLSYNPVQSKHIVIQWDEAEEQIDAIGLSTLFAWNIHDEPHTWRKGGGLECTVLKKLQAFEAHWVVV